MKIIHRKLAKYFPKGHIKEGQETYFKHSLSHNTRYNDAGKEFNLMIPPGGDMLSLGQTKNVKVLSKGHTIRGGKHFKPGDFIQFSEWSGKPYCSPSIKLFDPIEVVKVYDITLSKFGVWEINGRFIYEELLMRIAENDGLIYDDFLSWFSPNNKPVTFSGQIIVWDKSIEY